VTIFAFETQSNFSSSNWVSLSSDVVRVRGSRFTGEELLLITLVQLFYPHCSADFIRILPGRDRQDLQITFYWTLDHLIINWGYLITNNRSFWNDRLEELAETICIKFSSLPKF
jgi:hypothetical protein